MAAAGGGNGGGDGGGGAPVVVALDWTPNTNHTGFFVAARRGMYAKRGLTVELLSAADARYKGSYVSGGDGGGYATPCGLASTGEVTFAMNSPEGVVGWNLPACGASGRRERTLTTVAALCQRNTSAVAARKDITRPRELDGKRYASYAARFEGRIIQRLIQADGGTGDYEECVEPMLGLWNTVLKGEADATWVFTCWEGVQAEMSGDDQKLNYFMLEDYGIPYAYAPCLVAAPETLTARADDVRAFLAATAEGYEWAAAHPEEAARELVEGAKELCGDDSLDLEMCVRSQRKLGPAYLDGDGKWGRQTPERWNAYLDWLDKEGLLTTYANSRQPVKGQSATLDGLRAGDVGERIPRDQVRAEAIFTNEYFE